MTRDQMLAQRRADQREAILGEMERKQSKALTKAIEDYFGLPEEKSEEPITGAKALREMSVDAWLFDLAEFLTPELDAQAATLRAYAQVALDFEAEGDKDAYNLAAMQLGSLILTNISKGVVKAHMYREKNQ